MNHLPISEDIFQVQNNNKLLIAIVSLSVIACLAIAFIFSNKKQKISYGHIQMQKQYLNIGDLIFPDNEENQSRFIVRSPEKITTWIREYVNKTEFILKVDIGGILYTITNGSPGYAAPWRCVSITPVVEGVVPVVFTKHFHATKDVWIEDVNSRYFDYNEFSVLYWNTKHTSRLKFIEI